MARRSSVESLPPKILAVVNAAILEGATIDEIVRRMRARGGTRSRSAVARYVKQGRNRLSRRREDEGLAALMLLARGECPEGGTGQAAIETIRTLAMRAANALDDNEKPPGIEKISALALAMRRIESARKIAAHNHRATMKKGLSQETVARLRLAVAGPDDPKLREAFDAELEKRMREESEARERDWEAHRKWQQEGHQD